MDSSSDEEFGGFPDHSKKSKGKGSRRKSSDSTRGGKKGVGKDWQLILLKSFEKKDVHGKQFTMYEVVVVTDNGSSWRIYRRYSAFYQLYSKLKKEFPSFKPTFPKKHILGSLDAKVIEERRTGLSTFLFACMEADAVRKSPAFATFLDPAINPSFALLLAPEKEGFLTKRADLRRMLWKRRWFVLKSGTLYYFKTLQDSDPRGIIPLQMSTIEPTKDSERPYTFKVKSKDPTKPSMYLSADSEAERDEWMMALRTSGPGGGGGGAGRDIRGSSFSTPSSSVRSNSGFLANPMAYSLGSVDTDTSDLDAIPPLGSSVTSTGSLGSGVKHSSSFDRVSKLIQERDNSETGSVGGGSDSDIELEEEPVFSPDLKGVTGLEGSLAVPIQPPPPSSSGKHKEAATTLGSAAAKLVAGKVFVVYNDAGLVGACLVKTTEALDYILWESPPKAGKKKGKTQLIAVEDCEKLVKGRSTPALRKHANEANDASCFAIIGDEGGLNLQAGDAAEAGEWAGYFEKLIKVRGANAK